MTGSTQVQASEEPLFWVADNVIANDFPNVSGALREPDGLLAIGGALSEARLLAAYRRGIFPWYSDGQPILWWSPDPRFVLELNDLKISRSLARALRQPSFHVTFNQAFTDVITACGPARKGADGTWITSAMQTAYTGLYQAGYALSVETWTEGRLVGGLYGVIIGRIFFGESMFSHARDASKLALCHLVKALQRRDFCLIDCQVQSKHLQTLGAAPMPRKRFVQILKHHCSPEIVHHWPRVSEYR